MRIAVETDDATSCNAVCAKLLLENLFADDRYLIIFAYIYRRICIRVVDGKIITYAHAASTVGIVFDGGCVSVRTKSQKLLIRN